MRLLLPALTLPILACGTDRAPQPDNRWPSIDARWIDYQGAGATVGEPLGGFVLADQHGDATDFRQFLGAVTVIEIGATWCAPCQDFAAEQQVLHEALQTDGPVWVLTVLVQEASGGPPTVDDAMDWAQAFDLTVPVLADELQEQQDSWAVTAWPTTLVVAPDGTVLNRHETPTDPGTLADEVRAALADHADDLRKDR